jgi:hypothetical protein
MDNYVGLPISVISINGVRNEGILNSINLTDQSISLKTKDGIILLRATEIKDLEVLDENEEP